MGAPRCTAARIGCGPNAAQRSRGRWTSGFILAATPGAAALVEDEAV